MEYSASYVAIQESLFITIPSELVSAVFGYLAAKDLVVCSLVCRKWSQYSSYESVWKALCYRNWGWQKEINLEDEYKISSVRSWKSTYIYVASTYLKKSHYYAPRLTRDEAEEHLKNRTKGTFLVRDSSHKGHYVISRVDYGGEVVHQLVIKIKRFKGFFIETNNAIFSTLSELVKCNRKILKSSSLLPKIGLERNQANATLDPHSKAAMVIEQINQEKLALNTAIAQGLLHKLCKHGLHDLFAKLIESTKKFDSVTMNTKYKGKTPLHYLAQGASLTLNVEKFIDITQILNKFGADFNIKDSKQCTPIHYLIMDRNISHRMVSLFIEYGARVDGSEGVNEEGFNALGLAVHQGPHSVIKLLLDTVKITDAGDFIGNVITKDTLLHIAVMAESLQIVKLVTQSYPNTTVNVINRYGMTPLHAAVSFDQDWTNLAQFGKPMKAAKTYNYEIVEYLLSKLQADPNLTDENGKTPLHLSCENGHRTSTVCLLNKGADIKIKDNRGRVAEDYCRDQLMSPSSAVQWHLQALKERIHAGYTVLSTDTLIKRVESHYNEILKELQKYKK